MNAHDIIIRPIVSEKSFDLIEQGRYTFEVGKGRRSLRSPQAVDRGLQRDRHKVNTMNVSGKTAAAALQ